MVSTTTLAALSVASFVLSAYLFGYDRGRRATGRDWFDYSLAAAGWGAFAAATTAAKYGF